MARLCKLSAVFLLASLTLGASIAKTDLRQTYLIASEPKIEEIRDFPAILYRVENGGLTKVRTVVTGDQGTMFVLPYQDKGYIFIASEGAVPGSFLIDVIDLKAISRERSFDVDSCRGCRYLRSYLANKNGRLMYMLIASKETATGKDAQETFYYHAIDPRTGVAVDDWTPDDVIKSGYFYGRSGGFVDGEDKNIKDRVVPDEHVRRLFFPPLMKQHFSIRQRINNDYMQVTPVPGLWDENSTHWTWHIYDKVANKRVPLKLSGTMYPIRAYRHWLVSEEVYGYDPAQFDFDRLDAQKFSPFLSARERFELGLRRPAYREPWKVAPTGRLRLYNVRTGEFITHDTGEPNSEILLVDETDVVYFRVSDELRTADIVAGKLANQRLLAKAPELWGVHWLALGHE